MIGRISIPIPKNCNFINVNEIIMSKVIVVVEDFNSSRNIIKKTLETSGYSVLEAADGREAMNYFDGRHIDLVVTDYNMPNMDGAELVEYVRGKQQYLFIPILVLSTETRQDKKDRMMQLKITAWVKKPFEVQTFLKYVERALKV